MQLIYFCIILYSSKQTHCLVLQIVLHTYFLTVVLDMLSGYMQLHNVIFIIVRVFLSLAMLLYVCLILFSGRRAILISVVYKIFCSWLKSILFTLTYAEFSALN